MKKERKWLFRVFAVTVLLMLPSVGIPSEAPSDWKPAKPIRMVVPQDPGSSYDLIARAISPEISKLLGQTVYVENMPGAGQMLGTTYAYRAAPDGYTLLYAGSTYLLLNQLSQGASYDYRKFEYLTQTFDSNLGLNGVVASTKNGLKTWSDILKLNRPIRFADPGKGSPAHLTSLSLAKAYNLKAAYLTGFKGPESIMAVVRGECDLNSLPPAMWKAYVQSGDLSIVLWTSLKPLSDYSSEDVGWIPPNTPWIVQLGHPEVPQTAGTTHLILAPPGTPKRIVDALRSATYTAIASEGTKAFFKKMNMLPSYGALGDPKEIEKSLSKCWDKMKELEHSLK